MISKMKDILGERVTDVKISERLKESPAILINPEDGMSASMQKILQVMNKDTSIPKRLMEINKDSKLIRNLLKVFKTDNNDPYIESVTEQLYESALLLEGYLADPHKLVNQINKLLEDSSDWYTNLKEMK